MPDREEKIRKLETRLASVVEKARAELRRRGMTDTEIDDLLSADPRVADEEIDPLYRA